ncbi:MAG: nucleoside deaminase [Chryseotalea sp.]
MDKAQSDAHYMQEALKEAATAFDAGEIPVGAIVVCQNKIIARAHNQTEMLTDATAHAEMLAITAAANYLGSKYLNDCTLYVTLEPCAMCAGALHWTQIGRVVFGASDTQRGYRLWQQPLLHTKTAVTFGIDEKACQHLVLEFFKRVREK